MAIRFHDLPTHKFNPEVRPAIARLNRELRDLFGLEGVLTATSIGRKSDKSVTRTGTGTTTDSSTTVVTGPGRVRTGVPADRGDAKLRHPELFIQVDLSNAKCTLFCTFRSALASSYDWMELRSYTLS